MEISPWLKSPAYQIRSKNGLVMNLATTTSWVTHSGSQCFQLGPTIPQFETKLNKQAFISHLFTCTI